MNKNTHNSLTSPSPNRIEKEYHRNGKILSKTPYVNDKKHGLETKWWEGGKKNHEIMWKYGKKHGAETWWWNNLHKTWEAMWKEGKLHGVKTDWYDNGQKWCESYYIAAIGYARIEWDKEGNVTAVNSPKTAIPSNQIPSKITNLKNHIKKQAG